MTDLIKDTSERWAINKAFWNCLPTICALVVLVGCGGGGSGGQTCAPHQSKACSNNDIYWYNSCGAREDVFQDCSGPTPYCASSATSTQCVQCISNDHCQTNYACQNNSCVPNCTAHDSKACYADDVYWYDSCGTREELFQDCVVGETCCGGQCADISTCAKTFGGAGNDLASAVGLTSDGGYIVAGNTSSSGAGGTDVWIVKLDSVGSQSWATSTGGIEDDVAYSVEQTSDGGYILAGYTKSYGNGGGYADFWVVKLDSSGEQEWNKAFGGAVWDAAHSVRQTADGGYIVAGYTESSGAGEADFWVLKLNSTGDQAWAKTFGGTGDDPAFSIQQTSDGGYVVAGSTKSSGAGGYDFWMLKLDSSGTQDWGKTFGGTSDDEAKSVRVTSDGGYIVAGYTKSVGAGQADAWVMKLDSAGEQIWMNIFGGTGDDRATEVIQASDGGYAVVGYTASSGAGSYDVWLLKLDSDGKVWEKTFGGTGGDWGSSVVQKSDGSYAVAGYTNSYGSGGFDIWVLKLATNGECGWQ